MNSNSNSKLNNSRLNNSRLNNGIARMSIRDFSGSLTSKESHGYVCTLIYELIYKRFLKSYEKWESEKL